MKRDKNSSLVIGRRVKTKSQYIVRFAAGIGGAVLIALATNTYFRKLPNTIVTLNDFLAQQKPCSEPPSTTSLFLWHYRANIPNHYIENYDLLMPYKSGPPKKYIENIRFIDPQTRETKLALYGPKRGPTHFDYGDTLEALQKQFSSNNKRDSIDTLLHFLKHPYLAWNTTHLTRLCQDRTPLKPTTSSSSLVVFDRHRFFCDYNDEITAITLSGGTTDEPTFYAMQASKELCPQTLTTFVTTQSHAGANKPYTLDERIAHNTHAIQTALGALTQLKTNTNATPQSVQIAERRVLVALAAMATTNPQDKEVYFHIGKLTRSRTMREAAVQYARDTGLDQKLILELMSEVEQLTN